ncbi:MAG: hypothetical protein OSJ52_05615, partial [Lachnospiraceae bacterium]|nr:hypothetical protein [Lachnospiraceae bacterium]
MKVILSRKGCDSDFGGIPSMILPDGKIVYVPIPGDDFEMISYHDINISSKMTNLLDIVGQVSPYIKMYGKKSLMNSDTKCHLDPDLKEDYYPRMAGWQGCFGQADAAQTVLEHAKVGVGDLFLFFGWFQ